MTETFHAVQRDSKWQRNLLPFMTKTIIILSFFFFLTSLLQVGYLHLIISKDHNIDINSLLTNLNLKAGATQEQVLEAARLKALITLEASAMDNQYHEADILIMARLWTSYVGFVTGMILALVGTTFILGKLREPVSTLTTKFSAADISFKSTSPGLILAVLGTLLMLATILTHHNIDVKNKALYLHDVQVNSPNGDSLPYLPPPADPTTQKKSE